MYACYEAEIWRYVVIDIWKYFVGVLLFGYAYTRSFDRHSNTSQLQTRPQIETLTYKGYRISNIHATTQKWLCSFAKRLSTRLPYDGMTTCPGHWLNSWKDLMPRAICWTICISGLPKNCQRENKDIPYGYGSLWFTKKVQSREGAVHDNDCPDMDILLPHWVNKSLGKS